MWQHLKSWPRDSLVQKFPRFRNSKQIGTAVDTY